MHWRCYSMRDAFINDKHRCQDYCQIRDGENGEKCIRSQTSLQAFMSGPPMANSLGRMQI